MANVSININTVGLQTKIRRLKRAMSDPRPAFRKIGKLLEQSIFENFMRGGRPRRWASWSPKYAARTNSVGILVGPSRGRGAHGNLFNSMKILVTRRSVSVFSQSRYANVHNFGYPARNIPARPFMLIQDSDKREIGKIFERYIEGAWKR